MVTINGRTTTNLFSQEKDFRIVNKMAAPIGKNRSPPVLKNIFHFVKLKSSTPPLTLMKYLTNEHLNNEGRTNCIALNARTNRPNP